MLDDEARVRAQDPADLAQHLRVLLVAEVAQRREQVHGGVEALVGEGQLAVVGLDELRPPLMAGAAPGLGQQRRRAVDADDAIALPRQWHRVATEAAGDVEQVAAGRARSQARRGERLLLRLVLTPVIGVRAQVEVAEERVPGLGGARRAAFHAHASTPSSSSDAWSSAASR
jgi:hypothetical protein